MKYKSLRQVTNTIALVLVCVRVVVLGYNNDSMWNWLIQSMELYFFFEMVLVWNLVFNVKLLHLDGHNMEVIFAITCWSVWLYQVWFFEEFYTCSFTKMIFSCVYWIQIRWVVGKVSLILDTVILFLIASSLFSLCWEFHGNLNTSLDELPHTHVQKSISIVLKLNSCQDYVIE